MMRKTFMWALTLLLLSVGLGCIAFQSLTPEVTAPAPVEPAPTAAPPVVVAPPAGALADLQTQVEAVYAAMGDAVVNISVTALAYDFFLNPVPQEGSGSGFIYDQDGHIVTNWHVVDGAEEIMVTFSDGNMVSAEVVGLDQSNDLAVVKVDPAAHALTPAPLGRSDDLRVGQFVVAIGNPFGLEQTVTFGVISSLGRVIESPEINRFIGEAIQTDAAINPGNSGGPLLDLEGRVIGVNAQIVSPSQANAGIGFAIPVNTVHRVVPELIATGRYRHPWLGVNLFDLTRWGEILQDAGEDIPDEGLMVLETVENSPAETAGIRGGDRFITLGNVRRFPVG
ncbi:MAG: trypsin-like peptidase domain-containing protein, partial [Anaerolineae bacterium]|nr:trypsin-like peptidase domain-containing protein [Anaerolineae bacterium]